MIPFDRLQAETLSAIRKARPDWVCVVVGAAALGRFFDMRWRETGDVDFLISVAATEVEGALEELGFKRDARNPLRWHPRTGVPVDVLAVTPEVLARRKLVLDAGDREMNLTGLELAFAHSIDVAVGESTVKVAIPAIITLLKMIAWLDRPYERQKDLVDIARVLDAYLEDDDGRHWSSSTLASGVDYADHGALVLGQELAALANDDHLAFLDAFCTAICSDRWVTAMGRLVAPRSDDAERRVLSRFEALRLGAGR
jgi:predicted nucleotidyltransferase